MISRFQGKHGRPRLIRALRAQYIVCDEQPIATQLATAAEILQVEPTPAKNQLIQQGASDTDLYLILVGRVSVQVNGREVAKRGPGQHVGEMALIDPAARRSATVIALEQTVVARISEPVFTKLATKYPRLWRRLAIELADRLRQRGSLITPPNKTPILFIGSSAESLPVAREIQSSLAHDPVLVTLWTDGLFRASRGAVESLLETVGKADFAALVLTGDDTVISRKVQTAAPRDNCIFELGLFMGALGRERSFIVKPRGADIKLPSDLLGLTPLEYPLGTPDSLRARAAPLCTEIRKAVAQLGSK